MKVLAQTNDGQELIIAPAGTCRAMTDTVDAMRGVLASWGGLLAPGNDSTAGPVPLPAPISEVPIGRRCSECGKALAADANPNRKACSDVCAAAREKRLKRAEYARIAKIQARPGPARVRPKKAKGGKHALPPQAPDDDQD